MGGANNPACFRFQEARLPYKLQTHRLIPTGSFPSEPVGMAVRQMIDGATRDIVGMLRAVYTAQPMLLTDDQWSRLEYPYQQWFDYITPESASELAAHQFPPSRIDRSPDPVPISGQFISSAQELLREMPVEESNTPRVRLRRQRPTFSEDVPQRTPIHSNSGDTEPEDL